MDVYWHPSTKIHGILGHPNISPNIIHQKDKSAYTRIKYRTAAAIILVSDVIIKSSICVHINLLESLQLFFFLNDIKRPGAITHNNNYYFHSLWQSSKLRSRHKIDLDGKCTQI